MIKTLNLNVSGTKRDLTTEQKPDRFPSVGDHIHVAPTFEHTWETQHILLQEVLRNLSCGVDF